MLKSPSGLARSLAPLLATSLLLGACKREDRSQQLTTDPDPNKPSPSTGIALFERIPFAPLPASASTRFVELAASDTGIDFVNPIDEAHPLRYLYASSMATGGAAIADFDGDGKQDIFLASGPGTINSSARPRG